MTPLERAIQIAVNAHAGQTDKAGQPYILHPLRLMCRVRTDEERMAAVLHDVMEDTPVTAEDLAAAGIPGRVIAALHCLTKREGESYEDFITRIEPDPIARCVKLADLEDNMDVRRLPEVTEKDRQRLDRYARAWRRLRTGA